MLALHLFQGARAAVVFAGQEVVADLPHDGPERVGEVADAGLGTGCRDQRQQPQANRVGDGLERRTYVGGGSDDRH